jgi:GGDEF domain-containing protein
MSAERTSRAAVAAEELCAALWEALHEQLREGASERAVAFGERIAEVSRSVAELASLEEPRSSDEVRPTSKDEADARQRTHLGERGAAADGNADVGQGGAHVGEGPAEHRIADPDRAREHATIDVAGGAMLIDEQEDAAGPIAIRAARQSAQSGSWSAAVQRRLDRHREDGAPFAVLLLELLDVERLRIAQLPVDAEHQVRDVEAAIVEQLRPADALVREADGRYWLIAPDTDAVDARALAIRLGASARRSASHRGVPLQLAVGIAICPEHGVREGALLSHAKVDLYAAQARGEVLSDPDGAEPASS